ncbi:hypothetical protein F5X71_00395 [Nocardia brasiliensis]|uniref:Uncharacterized protein n=1 Tax=Nocardia brasiliensis TaxID=37326 RepID=A0A6G9XJA4_NOCBR|nr:hypothetical protein [Nocardia brasiliensis]QIS00991.1 hypothetical protein F5X71_00395 [Nocardia brasiliensis]
MQKPAHPPTSGSGISPRSVVPTEPELRKAAAELGLADENGNYDRSLRSRLAAAVQLAKREQEEAADPAAQSTARQLAHFQADLIAAGVRSDGAFEPLLVEAARHLLRSQGLRLDEREETTPS